MRSRVEQFGSGQATSASVVIQSLRVGRPLLGGEERQHRGQRVDREPLPRRQVQHLAPELEMVARLRPAVDRPALGRDHLDPQVVELEGVVRGVSHRSCPVRG